jgi:hypothetical protein
MKPFCLFSSSIKCIAAAQLSCCGAVATVRFVYIILLNDRDIAAVRRC